MKRQTRKLAAMCAMSAVSIFIFRSHAYAYIDPAASTYLFQTIMGVVVTIGAVGGFIFRRVKKKAAQKLGIDENRNKEVESDEILASDTEEKE